MIFQGLFNILDLYSSEIDLFYDSIDKYFREKISTHFGSILVEKVRSLLIEGLKDILAFLTEELSSLGFDNQYVKDKFVDQYFEFHEEDFKRIRTGFDIYEEKIAPIVYEMFLQQVVEYLVNPEASEIIINIKDKGLLPLEFIVELRNLKNIYEEDYEKADNLSKYLKIKEKIIKKFRENKNKIEKLEDLEDPRDKLQLIYLIFRIIDFFHLEKTFDFSHISEYIKDNVDEWLETIPLVSLKNPDLYFCGIYLATHLHIELKMEDQIKIKDFLLNLYEETIDEFESPLMEATDRLYYYFKSTEMVKLWLREKKFFKIIRIDPKFFETEYLMTMETSQLIVFLKITRMLGINQKLSQHEINAIIDEIKKRMSSEGIKQFREGFVSSEATYYVLFCNFMRDTLHQIKEYNLVEQVVSRIYRNLEMITFSEEMNFDLVSELFYSCESLKLLNCIETKEMIIQLASFLFPDKVVEKIKNSEDIGKKSTTRFRHLHVDKLTGETIYS